MPGRPYLTVCIDSFTRCILGVYVGFTPPSHQSVSACLKHCFLPKTTLKQEYSDITNEWNAFGVMRQLVVDGGSEFHSESMEQLCYSLDIEWHSSPRKNPWFKGHVERLIGSMSRALAHGVPGTTFANIFEKGDYDPLKHAVVSYSTFKWILHKWIVDVYHQQTHASLGKSPAAMWTDNVQPEDIRFPDDSTQLDEIMGKPYSKRLSASGIQHEGLYYNSLELASLLKRDGPKLRVDIRVDENDIGLIYVLDPKVATSYKVPAKNQEYAKGISMWQHQVFRNWQRKNVKPNLEIDGLLEAKEAIQLVIAEEFRLKNRRQSKRVARFQEDSSRANKTDGSRQSDQDLRYPLSEAECAEPSTSEGLKLVPSDHGRKVLPKFETIVRRPFTDE